jgi:hypothetical protein
VPAAPENRFWDHTEACWVTVLHDTDDSPGPATATPCPLPDQLEAEAACLEQRAALVADPPLG